MEAPELDLSEPLEGELVLASNTGSTALDVRNAQLRDNLKLAWLASQRSDNTRLGYRQDIESFFDWLDSDIRLPGALDVHRVHVDLYRHWLENGDHDGRYAGKRSYAASTIARKLATISSFYAYVVEETDYLARNPAKVKRPEVADESMTAGLDIGEARALIAAAELRGLRESAIVRTLLTTGMRVSELCKADTADLSVERGHRVITITRKGGKRQKLPVPRSAALAIDVYLTGRKGPLFLAGDGTRIKRQHVWWIIRKITEQAKIDKVISPHSLRHTAATLALDAGESIREVQQMLGHVDPKTTTRYDRARGNLDHSSVHALERVLGGAVAES